MDLYEEIVRMRREGQSGALATIIAAQGSIPSSAAAKMLIRGDGSIVGTIGGGCVEAQVITAARKVMELERPETLSFDLHQNPGLDTGLICGGSLEVFLEPITPSPTLYVFGAGHVGYAVYAIARLAGFDLVIVDDRTSFANRDRFPEAREIVAEEWGAAMTRLAPGGNDYLLIVTRGHRGDLQVLRWALDTPARYIGMIGSRRKVATLQQQLQAEGVAPERFDRVNAPVGLDIGAVSPEEIAVAIVAELITVRRRRKAVVEHKRSLLRKAETVA